MAWPESAHITERVVLRVLIAGFALVVTLLGLAGFVAVRSTRAIEGDAAQVGREQVTMARLLNEIQAGQNTMAAILHELAAGQDAIDREALLRDLEEADRALASVAESAGGTPESARWHDLKKAVGEFSRGVRTAIHRRKPLTADDIGELFDLHDNVVEVVRKLLESSEHRMEATERHIETESRDLATKSRILLGSSLLFGLLCAATTIVFARSSIRKIEWQASELSRVSWHMLQGQESMARRFSHELHDELGQSLAAVKANLTAGASGDWQERRPDTVRLVDEAIANVRELSQLLHPVILDDFGLDAGLRWLTDGFSQRTGIHTEYVSKFNGRMSDSIETHLFRIAQEALTNVARHANASSVGVELRRDGDVLRLVIADNGRGMKTQAPRHASLGLTGMRARATEIGGAIRWISPPEGGLRIEVDAPLRSGEGTHVEQENPHRIGG